MAKVAGLKMQGSGGLHGLVSDTCEDRNVGMQGTSENVAHARAANGLRLRRASQLQGGFDNCASDHVRGSGKQQGKDLSNIPPIYVAKCRQQERVPSRLRSSTRKHAAAWWLLDLGPTRGLDVGGWHEAARSLRLLPWPPWLHRAEAPGRWARGGSAGESIRLR